MKSVFFKMFAPTVGLLVGATLLFAVSLGGVLWESRQLEAARRRWNVLEQEERKLQALEAFAASVVRHQAFMERLSVSREASVQEVISLEPFGVFVEKLSRIYTDQGFFFLESFALKICEEGRGDGDETEAECRPAAEVRGRKVFFQP